jgi:hypothetical protein
MKLRVMEVTAFGPKASALELQADINDWLAEEDEDGHPLRGEGTFEDADFLTDGTRFWAFVTWVPE